MYCIVKRDNVTSHTSHVTNHDDRTENKSRFVLKEREREKPGTEGGYRFQMFGG